MLTIAAMACATPVLAQAPAEPAPAAQPAETAATQARIVKLNAYVALLNRTLRASESIERYESWVRNMKSGPTGKESIVYGLYSLYDVSGEIEKAKAATTAEPAMPELDAAIPAYIAAYEALAPVVTEADGYYERQDYKDDKMAGGKALHARLAPAAAAYTAERAKVDKLFAAEKEKADEAELALIEQTQGRKARWHVANVMVRARHVVDLFPNENKPVVDMPVFEAAILTYAAAVKDMDAYSAANPNSFFVFESRPRSFLGKLREFRDKLQKAKGDARKGAGRDLTWLVNDYNTMVSTSESATQFAK
ncbi:YiiG family protein [Hansschlegelia quercus]|uniref:YiiG family protein n=1 Tax=Hansschlegelia quercus TaxID=2528245 RepID=UPI001FE1D343|nr:YiiG family protein [Hansschlegelia quercus]